MEKLGDRKITANELTFLLVGIMLDISVAGLPNEAIKVAKQDGWISAGLGAIYPLYIAILAIYISKKHPDENILILSRKCFGKVLGTILNLLFLLSFFSYFPALMSLLNVITVTYVAPFLTSMKIYIFLCIVGAYTARKGIKILGKVCTITFYIVLTIMLVSAFALSRGSILNIQPILGSGIPNILKGITSSAYDYALLEFVFLIYPLVDDKSKIKGATLKATLYSCAIYTWISFITIYYMGTNIINKTLWGFFSVTEAIKVEVINNFRYIFVSLWIIIGIKSVSLMYYTAIFFIEDIRKKKSGPFIYILIAIVLIFLAKKYYPDIVIRESIIKVTAKYSVIYNCIYITLIAILIFFKRDEKNEEK